MIKVLPNQIPQLWDAIKYAVCSTNQLASGNKVYMNTLLQDLLSDKAQCFIRTEEDNILAMIVITEISADSMTGDRTLVVKSLFSFKPVDDAVWISDMNQLIKAASNLECKKIIAHSSNPRVFDICQMLGFSERSRCFEYRLEA